MSRTGWSVFLALTACGGSVGAGPPDAGPDGASPIPEATVPDATDATMCPDACGLAPIDAAQGNDATDAFAGSDASDAGDASDGFDASVDDAADAADAPEEIDFPPVSHNEVCHVAWPQPAGFQGLGNISMPLLVDSAGNVYVQIPYSSAPPIDLGVPLPGDPQGIAIAKVDPQCHLLWVREFGAPPTADGGYPSIGGGLAAVDDSSNVTLAGTFDGPIDLGGGPLDGYQVGYVLRLDASGNVVFTRTYPGDFPGMVGVQPEGGPTSLLFFDYGAFEGYLTCALNHCDAGLLEAGLNYFSFAQIDSAGTEITRHSFPGVPGTTGISPPTFTDMRMDSTGTLWAIDNLADAGPSVERLTQFGVPIWSQPTGTADLVLGPKGGVVYSFSDPTLDETFSLYGFDGGASWTNALRLGVSAPFAGNVAIGPSGMIYSAGQVDPRALPPGDAQWPSSVVGVEVLDPLGRPQEIRAWTGLSNDLYGTGGVGVDPSGNAVVAGYSVDEDGGYTYFVVKLGP